MRVELGQIATQTVQLMQKSSNSTKKRDSMTECATLSLISDVNAQLPQAIIMGADGVAWQFHQRMYGGSWYRPGDSQPHNSRDIALPAVLLRPGRPWDYGDDCE